MIVIFIIQLYNVILIANDKHVTNDTSPSQVRFRTAGKEAENGNYRTDDGTDHEKDTEESTRDDNKVSTGKSTEKDNGNGTENKKDSRVDNKNKKDSRDDNETDVEKSIDPDCRNIND